MSANASSSSKSDSTEKDSPSTFGYVCPLCGWLLSYEAREPTVRGAMLREHQEDHGRRGSPRDLFVFGFVDELTTELDVEVEDDASA